MNNKVIMENSRRAYTTNYMLGLYNYEIHNSTKAYAPVKITEATIGLPHKILPDRRTKT